MFDFVIAESPCVLVFRILRLVPAVSQQVVAKFGALGNLVETGVTVQQPRSDFLKENITVFFSRLSLRRLSNSRNMATRNMPTMTGEM